MTGIVLAGGENRRMGADKAFLPFAGIPLVEHVLRPLKQLFREIIVVTNSPERYAAYGVAVVRDAFNKRGPLTGIYSGLMRSKDEYNFVVGCDMPFLNARLISYMTALAEGYDAVVPTIGEFMEPLHAVYCKGILPVIEERIRQNDQRIRNMLATLRIRYVLKEEIDRFDPERKSFKNLNTRQEYEEASSVDWEYRS
ncbi:MAG TPA: molybdenum cofactor guanylyltransferase [Nitrospirota bacterium]|nr:molybdenum cofactor guanylyltransferase [Nitrospirota bacterium]